MMEETEIQVRKVHAIFGADFQTRMNPAKRPDCARFTAALPPRNS
jgi:hypothetical protein